MAYDGCGKIIYANKNITEYVYDSLGERCVTSSIIIPTTIIYGFILFLGVFGNICTCIVIIKNKSMQTPTNYYLFSLAVSDLLVLILGLPMELYGVFDAVYPYQFGEFICKLRAFLIEFTSYASILTITCFSIERWLAICFPLRIKMFSTLHRAIRVIIAVWVIAFIAATPMVFIVVINKLDLPEDALDRPWTHLISKDGRTVDGTEYCSMDATKPDDQKRLIYTAFFVFFLMPAILISVVYCHIVLKLKSVDHLLKEPNESQRKKNKSRRSLLKVLVSVVVMFFLCWLPFHIQRLLSIFLNESQENGQPGSPAVHYLFNVVFYISGYCYYSNSACNPILYNILSEKYRVAFCRTILGDRTAQKILNYKNRNLMMHSYVSGHYYPQHPPAGRSRSSNHLLKPSKLVVTPTRAASISVSKKNDNGELVGRLSPMRHHSESECYTQSQETLATPLLSLPQSNYNINEEDENFCIYKL